MNKQLRIKINKCQNLEEKVIITLIVYVIFIAYLSCFLLFVYVVNFLSSLFVTAASRATSMGRIKCPEKLHYRNVH